MFRLVLNGTASQFTKSNRETQIRKGLYSPITDYETIDLYNRIFFSEHSFPCNYIPRSKHSIGFRTF